MGQNKLEGKVALVTGAAAKRGMGRAIALRLASEGADVVVLDKFAAPKSAFAGDEGWRGLDEEVEEIKAMGRNAMALTLDISSVSEVNAGVASAIAKMGKLDILVNCAAIRGTANVEIVDGNEAEWKSMFEINLLGSFLISKPIAQHMIKRGEGGKMVLFASLAGRFGVKGNAAYSASKWGVIGLAQSLALELAPHKINVNAICPGAIITNLRDGHMEAGAKKAGVSTEEFRQKEYDMVGKTVPIGRMGQVDDIANAVAFLVSSQADYITGQSLNVCGGAHMD